MSDRERDPQIGLDGELVEIWGERSHSLPSRPVRIAALRSLLDKDEISEIRVPIERPDPDPGPLIWADDPAKTSQFSLVMHDGTRFERYCYGWPEVIKGRLPVDTSLIAWRHETVQLDELDELAAGWGLDTDESISQRIWDRTESIEGVEP